MHAIIELFLESTRRREEFEVSQSPRVSVVDNPATEVPSTPYLSGNRAIRLASDARAVATEPHLDFSACSLTGAIPDALCACGALAQLNLEENEFEGEIPVALLRWKFVEGRVVELRGNAGLRLPANLGELGAAVVRLDLADHNLQGRIPESIGALGQLRELSLFKNRLEGEIPPSLGQLTALQTLNLSWNLLRGGLPRGLSATLTWLAPVIRQSALAEKRSGVTPDMLITLAAFRKPPPAERRRASTRS